MAELGLLQPGCADPDRGRSLVAPDGVEITAGELAEPREPDRARPAGPRPRAGRHRRRRSCPTASRWSQLVPRRPPQIGLYITPINHHLVGPEIAYIVNDSDAKVLVGHERFADELAQAAGRGRASRPTGASPSATVEGFRPVRRAHRRPARHRGPTTAPPARPMHYTSGTTGKPKGVKRALVDIDPDELGALYCGLPVHVRRAAATTATCTSPARRSTTRPCCCGRRTRCTSATRSC